MPPSNLPLQYELNFGPMDEVSWANADALGHTIGNSSGNVAIHVKNDNAADVTLTILSARESDFGPYPAWTFIVKSGTQRKTPTFDPRRFSDPLTKLLTFMLSVTTDVQVAALVQQQKFKD